MGLSFRRQPAKPETIDAEARTVRLVWSQGAAVERPAWDEPFLEVLDLSGVVLDRLRNAPLLDTHSQSSVEKILGRVLDVGIENGEGWAIVQFSERPDVEPIWRDVAAGIISNVSCGYTVQEWQESRDASGRRIMTAVKWTPIEISLVPVAADPGASVRSQPQEYTMPEQTPVPPAGNSPAPVIATRSAINAEIRSIAELAGQDVAFSNDLIDREATADEARSLAFQAMRERSARPIQTQRASVGESFDDPEFRCRAMGEAVFSRLDPSHALSEPARQFAYMSLSDLARETLRVRGISTTALSKAEIVTRSLHTTTDFATILGSTVGRSLRKAYEVSAGNLKKAARQTSAPDFRTRYKVQLGEAPTLQKVNEAGEFKSGTMAEAKESYKVDTFGRIVGISRQAIINDDLGAFGDVSTRLGIAAAAFETQTLVDLLVSNAGAGPTMDDTVALFHANHKNLAGAGAVISEATLSAARLALRKQTGLSGGLIEVAPKFLVVPPDLETAAEKQLAALAAAKTSDVNPFANQLTLLVENRLTNATRWYVTADPALIDGLEYAYLEGQSGPQIESRNGFEIDGVQIKVRDDFGCGFVEYRSWYSNPGA